MKILIILLIISLIVIIGLFIFIRRLLSDIRDQGNEIKLLHKIIKKVDKYTGLRKLDKKVA